MTPDQIKRLYAKALAAQNGGRLADAAKAYDKLLRAHPNLPEPHFQQGKIAALKPDFERAAHHFEAALKLRPSEMAIWLAYLDLASKHPNASLLVKLLSRLPKASDASPELAFYRGLAALRGGASGDAKADLLSAAGAGWSDPRGLVELSALEQGPAALELLDRALTLAPDNVAAIARKCDLLRDMGQFEEAKILARDGLTRAPNAGGLYYSYASIAKLAADDPMIDQMKSLQAAHKLKGREAIFLNTALAKAAQDTGKAAQVFEYLVTANKLNEKLYPYEFEADQSQAKRFRTLYDDFVDAQTAPSTGEGPRPIFVTGMPRSGTTLVEQIIASHSSVAGGGELGLLGPDLLKALDEAPDFDAVRLGLGEAAQGYLTQLAERFPGAAAVTDKSISSYATLGFVAAALPQARLIIVRRDVRDNALSVYKNLFAFGQHRYATNLRNIARMFRLFEDQMAFWASKSGIAFHQIRYEDLIAEPESQARSLIEACALEWEDACLTFYETDRQIATLSSAQVRQPLYSSSIGAWRAFEDELAPFTQEYIRLGGALE